MSPNRSIFEEVDAEAPSTPKTPKQSLIDQGRDIWRGFAKIWLIVLLLMVASMILVGGLTRLTDSGLSITEWNLVTGAVPPLSQADWISEFEKYQTIPEFLLVNSEMTLAEFKYIYWWEWGHRQLGRMVGLVWAVGFAYLIIRHSIPRAWVRRFVILGALGGLQGAIGWWMVSSGLHGRMIDVASYRLAIHLGMAFLIISMIFWSILRLSRAEMELFQASRVATKQLMPLAAGLFALIFIQILLGALVAGIDAGRGYIDWPLMGGQFLPSESFDYLPKWTNFFENPALVQFNHRMLAYVITIVAVLFWWKSRRSAHDAIKSNGLLVLSLVFLQMLLGIITVRLAAPLHMAILHQLGAILLVLGVLRAKFWVIYPPKQSVTDGVK